MLRQIGTRAIQHGRRLFSTKAAAPGTGPNHRSIMALDGHSIRPFVQPNAFIAPSASIIGSVTVNDKSAVMYGAVVRGDLALIQIGALTVIGENSILTAGAVDSSSEISPSEAVAMGLSLEPELFVGDYCLVGPNVSMESCHVDGFNVIGAGSTIEKGARVGRYVVLEAGSRVPAGTEIPDGEIWGGCPAVKVGEVTDDHKVEVQRAAEVRYGVTQDHMYEFLPYGTAYLEKEALARAERKAAIEAKN